MPPKGHAEAGIYVPDAALQHALQNTQRMSHGKEIRQESFRLADWQTFIDPREQRTYDGLVGLLFDAGVDGELRDEYLYLGQELIGNVYSEADVFALQMSNTSLQISVTDSSSRNGLETSVVLEPEGDLLEARQVRDAFLQFRNELRLARAWRDESLLSSNSRIRFGQVEVSRDLFSDPITMSVETRRGAWRVEVRSDRRNSHYRYAITDVERAVDVGWRVSDALLEDFAEAGGRPASRWEVIEGMLRVSAAVSE